MKRALIWLPLGLFGVFFAVVAAGLMRPADTTVHSTLVDKPLPVFQLEPMVPGKPGWRAAISERQAAPAQRLRQLVHPLHCRGAAADGAEGAGRADRRHRDP